jgi:hypothetical protein
MIWQQFLILLKRLQLQCADGKQVHGFHQDPSPVKKSIRGDVEGYRRENFEQARVLTRPHREEENFAAVAKKFSIQGCTNPRRTAYRTRLAVS